jgi:hypothetical protein
MSTYVQPSPHRGGVVGPLILIALGVVFLMNTLGYLTWDVWSAMVRLWPLLLVGAGLDLLFGGQSILARLLVALAVLLLFVVGFWYFSSNLFTATQWSEQRFSQDVGRANNAEVTLHGGVGLFQVGPVENSEQLIEATLDLAPNEEATESYEIKNGTVFYTLNTTSEGNIGTMPFWQRGNEKTWSIWLNGDLPMDLTISTGVGESKLELSQLNLTDLSVQAGVGQTTVTLPQQGDYTATIHAGVGGVTIYIPESVAALINIDTGLGPVNVEGSFERNGEQYVSRDWSGAEHRVTLQVDAGVGTVHIIAD